MAFDPGIRAPAHGRTALDDILFALALGVVLSCLHVASAPAAGPPNELKLSEAQARNLGVRVARPIASRTDLTLPYPGQIVIPTPQLWVVSAPVAGMVANLMVGRGDHASAGQPLVAMESPSFVSQQRDYLQALAAHHSLMQAAVKTKQVVDVAACDALDHAIEDVGKMYTK